MAERDEWTEEKLRRHAESFPRDCLGDAWVGAVLIGVILPTLLVCWNCGSAGPQIHSPPAASLVELIASWVRLTFFAVMGCGPGAAILATVLYRNLKRGANEAETKLREVVDRGMFLGALMAFLNVPGYLCGAVLPRMNPGVLLLKMAALFVVAGASAGAWIGWQAWRATHPKEPFWPRYSLLTLLIVVIAWGALMGLFAPK